MKYIVFFLLFSCYSAYAQKQCAGCKVTLQPKLLSAKAMDSTARVVMAWKPFDKKTKYVFYYKLGNECCWKHITTYHNYVIFYPLLGLLYNYTVQDYNASVTKRGSFCIECQK